MNRERDLNKLAVLVDSGALEEREAEPFYEMQRYLKDSIHRELTGKQRRWIDDKIRECGLDPDKKPVPRGKPGETPNVLKNLPMKPPGR